MPRGARCGAGGSMPETKPRGENTTKGRSCSGVLVRWQVGGPLHVVAAAVGPGPAFYPFPCFSALASARPNPSRKLTLISSDYRPEKWPQIAHNERIVRGIGSLSCAGLGCALEDMRTRVRFFFPLATRRSSKTFSSIRTARTQQISSEIHRRRRRRKT